MRHQDRPAWTGRRLADACTAPRLLTVAVVLAVVAVLAGRDAWTAKLVHHYHAVPGVSVPVVDAAGCPVTARCRVGATPPPAMLQAIQRAFPKARVTFAAGVYDQASGAAYRVTVVAQLDSSSVLQLIAQRLPGSPPNDPGFSSSAAQNRTDLAGNSVVDSRTLVTVAPGPPGSMVQLTLNSIGNADATAAMALSRDPNLQLTS